MRKTADMSQAERQRWLIDYLLAENPEGLEIPAAGWQQENEETQRLLLRALLNVRPPQPASPEFYGVQDAYLQEEIRRAGITDAGSLPEVEPGISLWQGDITTLACDAIVNAANEYMLGCFIPNHRCIDNAIHTYAGVQLRQACEELMQQQGHLEETGKAKITEAYNLPSRYVLHTVGPIVYGEVTEEEKRLLADCYRECLDLAWESGLRQVAFCCISTGVFHFPNELAAQIAVDTVRRWRQGREEMSVIFNVFKEEDYAIYASQF